jgi:hypothetical protein
MRNIPEMDKLMSRKLGNVPEDLGGPFELHLMDLGRSLGNDQDILDTYSATPKE